jgi:transcriptional regulator with XRE-family HTH domain
LEVNPVNNLSSIRKERGYIHQGDFAAALKIPYIDAPMLSRIEQGKCNPIPADALKIADNLGKPLSELWDASDLDYGISRDSPEMSSQAIANGLKPKKIDMRSKVTVRKCFRISKTTDEWFTIEKLRAAGYMSFQSWFDACVHRFKGEYAASCKRRDRLSSATASAANE